MTDESLDPPAKTVDTIVLLSVDSLRLDRVHIERNGTPLTPNVDALADHSLEFAEGISPGPGTNDSVPSILTGAYPSQFPGFSLPPPGTEPLTLAEHLEREGFSCAGFNQNNLITRRYNFDRGFDNYFDISKETREETGGATWRLMVRDFIEGTPLMEVAKWFQFRLMETFGKSLFTINDTGDKLTDQALEWLDETDGKRFLWLHYMDTHHPYVSTKPIQHKFGVDIPEREMLQLSRKARTDADRLTSEEVERLQLHYDCAVRFVDEQIGRVIDYLEVHDDLENSLVVVTADHGEEFLEHGKFGHRYALWDELIRVPLIVRYPPVAHRDVDGQAPVQSLVDTVVEGSGWFDMLDGGTDYIISETRHGADRVRAVRGNGFKLMADDGEQTFTRYGDGEETIVDSSEVPDDVLVDLETELERTHEQYESEAIDEEALHDDLAALGYLDE